MEVLILSNSDGGLYQFRRELIQQLSENHTVFCSIPDSDGYVEKLEQLGCKCVVTDFNKNGKNPIRDLKLYRTYIHLIKTIKPSIVLTYTIKPNIYGGIACQRINIPYISNITGLGPAVENDGLLQKITVPMYRYGLRKAQRVFFQNQANLDFMIQKKVVRGSYALIPGSGVNLERFRTLNYPKGDTIDFTFIGRVIKQKGIEQFLDAARAIRMKYPETRFHICGRCDPEYEEIIKELNDAGILIYHGSIDDIMGMHQINCCTVHPTFYPEGMSNVLLESCACGRPIITTDRPGCREIVDDGVNGFVVKQRDSADLIEKIERFLSLSWEERRQMGLAGRVKVEKEFDRNIVIQQYLEEIKKVSMQ